MKRLFLALFFVSIIFLPAYAEDFVFPVPKDRIFIINGYDRSPTHASEKSKYSLDFQMKDTNRPATKDFGHQCYSIGAPILATKSGQVLAVKYPKSDKELNQGYGYVVRVGYPDGSYTWYAHMLEGTIAVEAGQQVQKGQILGLLGATGSTYGQVCNWENNIDVQVENEAPHLHFETNDKNTNAVLTEPLVGKERYTNLVDLREKYKEYYSTTLMYDPTNHWAKYRGKVPYSLVYSPSAIHSFSPLIVQAGEEQIFTIKGESLTDDLAVTLPGCSNMNWLKKEPDEQQFSCNMSSITGMKSGFIRFSSGSKPDFNFQVEIISGDKTPEPMIAKAEAVNPLADKTTQFIVEGENIPGDLEFDLPLCSNLSYAKITPSYREFSCRLPHTVKGENRKRVNGMYTFNTNFTSESASYSYPLSFTVDYGVRVNNMEPVMAIGGTKTVFTFTGKSLNLAKAIWIEKCDNFREIDRSDEMIKVSCTPQNPYKPWHLFVPDFLQKDFYRVLIKDEPGGTTLFDSQILIFSDDTVEDILEDEVFEITDQGGDLDEYNLNPEDLDNLVKSNCTLYTNIFDASMFVQNKSSFTHKNKLLPLVNLGYKKEKDSIAFFVKKTNSSFFNAVNPGATTDSYKSLISQFGLKEVGINVNGYDVTYNISTKEMESMLNQGYCFISLIENNYDTSHAGYHEGMGGVENYFNSVK